ncbi:MAG: cytochrome c oxidase assembly protein, partial [Pseudomonadota bacterium]|nr:cytochrome c oxidase assembly protein [Pseudomonadota bacterium]
MRALIILVAALAVLVAGPAFSHGSDEAATGAWVTHPWLLLTVFAALCWYALGLRRQRREGRVPTGADRLRPLAFAASMAVLAFALASPLDAWAERSFPVHMTQHLLLMLLAAPLLAWARPVLTGLWAFPLRERRRIGRVWNRLGVLRGIHEFLMRPMVAWSLASMALWVWHIPAAFDAALSHEWLHTTEHLCFLLTSVAFWTLAMPPYRGE